MQLEELFHLNTEQLQEAGGTLVPELEIHIDTGARERHMKSMHTLRSELLHQATIAELLPYGIADWRDWQIERQVMEVIGAGYASNHDMDLLLKILGTIPRAYEKKSGRTVQVTDEDVIVTINTGRKVYGFRFKKDRFDSLDY